MGWPALSRDLVPAVHVAEPIDTTARTTLSVEPISPPLPSAPSRRHQWSTYCRCRRIGALRADVIQGFAGCSAESVKVTSMAAFRVELGARHPTVWTPE